MSIDAIMEELEHREVIRTCIFCVTNASSPINVELAKCKTHVDLEKIKDCSHIACYENGIKCLANLHQSILIKQIAQYANDAITTGHFIVISDLWDLFQSKIKSDFLRQLLPNMTSEELRVILKQQINDGRLIEIPNWFFIQDKGREIDPDTCAEISHVATRLHDDIEHYNNAQNKDGNFIPESVQLFLDAFEKNACDEDISNIRRVVKNRMNISIQEPKRDQNECLLKVQRMQQSQHLQSRQEVRKSRIELLKDLLSENKERKGSTSSPAQSQNEGEANEIMSAAEQDDDMHVMSILDQCTPETKRELSLKAMPGAIANQNDSLFQYLLLQHKTSSKTSSKVNQISDPIICLYECIDRNNAVMVKVITEQLLKGSELDTKLILELLKYAISKTTDESIVRFIACLLPQKDSQGKSFDTYRQIISTLVSPLLPAIALDRITVYTQMRLGLFKSNKKGLKYITTFFPVAVHKIKELQKEFAMPLKEHEEKPDFQKYFFEAMFSHHSLDDYLEWHSTHSKHGSRHQFSKHPSISNDKDLKTDIIRRVDFYKTYPAIQNERQDIIKAIDDFMDNLCKIIGNREPDFKCIPRRVGSSFENTRPFSPDEYDFIISLLKLGQNFKLSYLQSFVFFQWNKEKEPMEEERNLLDKISNNWYLNSDKLRALLNSLIHDILRNDINSFWSILSSVSTNHDTCPDQMISVCSDDRLTIDPVAFFSSKHRFTALTLLWRGAQFKYLPIKIDIVPAFECTDSHRFPTPPHDFLSDCEAKPLYIVAFGSPVGFQICHTVHEAECIRNLPSHVTLGYTYAKAMRQSIILQSPKSQSIIRTLNNYEEVCTSYMLKQAVLVLTQAKTLAKSIESPIAWAIFLFQKLRMFLKKGKRIPQFMMNSENLDTKECVFKLDDMHHNLRTRERRWVLAIIDRILQVLCSGELWGKLSLLQLKEMVFKDNVLPVDCLHIFSLLDADNNEYIDAERLLEMWHTYTIAHIEKGIELQNSFPDLNAQVVKAPTLPHLEIPKMTASSLLPSLTHVIDNTWISKSAVRFDTSTGIIRVIKNNIWVCEFKRITVLDVNNQVMYSLPLEEMGKVLDIAPIGEEEFVIGSSYGLYETKEKHINPEKVRDGHFTNLVVYGSLVYAAEYKTRTVHILQRFRSEWMQHHIIKLKDSPETPWNWITLTISNGKLDDQLDSCEMKWPSICGSDSEGAILVAEWNNDRLQVRDINEEWHVIELTPEAKSPRSAVLLNDDLFVLSTPVGGLNVLMRYQAGARKAMTL